MRIDAKDIQRHYESLSDDELLAIDAGELTEVARQVHEDECARRGLQHEAEPEPEPEEDDDQPVAVSEEEDIEDQDDLAEMDDIGDGNLDVDTGPPPEWAEDAACACSFSMRRGDVCGKDAARARTVLRNVGIPCSLVLTPAEEEGGDALYSLMVPGALTLHATAVLDRDLFNEQHEVDWRNTFETLTDKELRSLNPEVFCSGLLDRVARLKRVYSEELARRAVKKV